MISFSKCLVLISVATSVLAQDGSHGDGGSHQLSQSCQEALAQLANNADASKCLAIPQFPAIYANPDASVVQPVDNWLKAMCSVEPCNDQTLSTVVTTFIQGCPEESKHWGIKDTSNAIETVKKYYPVYRKVFCLKHNNNLCTTETLSSYEKSVGTLTYTKLDSFYDADPTSFPRDVVCTNCGKAAYNVLISSLGTNSEVTNKFKQLCGDSFVDGQNPSDVSGV